MVSEVPTLARGRHLPNLADEGVLEVLAGIDENARPLVEKINEKLSSATESILIPMPKSLGLDLVAEAKVVSIYLALGWQVEDAFSNGNQGRCRRFA